MCRTVNKCALEEGIFTCANPVCRYESLISDVPVVPDSLAAHRVLARYTEALGVKFLVGGNEMPHTSVFLLEPFLPVVIGHAKRVWRRRTIKDGVMDQTNSTGAEI